MARASFKRWLTRYIPAAAERSTYVLFSSLALILLIALWEPMGGVVWSVGSPLAQSLVYGLFGLGLVLVLVSTFLINHFDLFGLRQVWLNLIGREYEPVQFKLHSLYRYVRHPLYVGFFVAIWATPTMTIAHLVFSVMCSAYILIGTHSRNATCAASIRNTTPMPVRCPASFRSSVASIQPRSATWPEYHAGRRPARRRPAASRGKSP